MKGVIVFIILGLMVVFMKNPVHNVLSLIFVSMSIVKLVLSWGVDYYGIIVLLVYVGAITVLFLFVVMLMNIRFEERLEGKLSYVPLACMVGMILCIEFLAMVYSYSKNFGKMAEMDVWGGLVDRLENIELIGVGLYVEYGDGVVLGSFVLLIGIIGSLVITGRGERWVKDLIDVEEYTQRFRVIETEVLRRIRSTKIYGILEKKYREEESDKFFRVGLCMYFLALYGICGIGGWYTMRGIPVEILSVKLGELGVMEAMTRGG